MRLAIPLALVLAAATSRGGCGHATPYDPCAGKACGDACTLCAPGDPGCAETQLVKACSLDRQCVAQQAAICDGTKVDCVGKACGERCTIVPPCTYATPPCAVAALAGYCDATATCVAIDVVPPAPCPPAAGRECLGKACGTPCSFDCPYGAPCPLLPVAPSCNGNQTCALPVPWDACYDPCAGKACGATCHLCPPGAPCGETTELKQCNPDGRCVSWTPSFACPP